MTENDRRFVISVYSENQIGLLSSLSAIFTRRNINIESLTVFPSEFPGIHHFIFRVFTSPGDAEQVVKVIEKKVDVLKAFYFESSDVSASEHDIVAEYLNGRNK